jgi:hypothetical protein
MQLIGSTLGGWGVWRCGPTVTIGIYMRMQTSGTNPLHLPLYRYNSARRYAPWWCVEAGALWVAGKTADGVLGAAVSFLDRVARGAGLWALNAARATLEACRATANGVLTGAHWVQRQACERALQVGGLVAADKLPWKCHCGVLAALQHV